jgi:hypothetical protein
MNRILTLVGACLGVTLLVVQFALSIPALTAAGDSLGQAVVTFFSFFTILTNLAITLVYLGALAPALPLGWTRRHATRTMMAAIMLLVMIVYHVLLAPIWDPQGLFRVADYGLHYVAPLVYTAWWATLPRDGKRLPYSAALTMIAPPLVYLFYVLVRGAFTGLYPYPFIDAGEIGYASLTVNAIGISAVLVALYLAAIAVDRRLSATA